MGRWQATCWNWLPAPEVLLPFLSLCHSVQSLSQSHTHALYGVRPGPDPLDPSISIPGAGAGSGMSCSLLLGSCPSPHSALGYSRVPVPNPRPHQLHSTSLGLSAEPVFLVAHNSVCILATAMRKANMYQLVRFCTAEMKVSVRSGLGPWTLGKT